MSEPIYNVTLTEPMRDWATGEQVKVGDAVLVQGYVLPDGRICGEKLHIEHEEQVIKKS